MLEFYIKICINWTDNAENQNTTFFSTFCKGVYKSPYHKGGVLNDVFLIGKALKHFAGENPEAKILEIGVIEIAQKEDCEKGAF